MPSKKNNRRTSTKAPPSNDYWATSQDLFLSFLLVIPLFLIYQVGVLTTGGAVNGVDFTTRTLFSLTGGKLSWYLAFNGAVLVGLLLALKTLPKKKKLHPGIWAWVVIESTLYAFFLSGVVNSIITGVLHVSPPLVVGGLTAGGQVIMSIGAGFFEELVFRLLLLSGLVALLHRVFLVPRSVAAVVGVLVSSFLFSAAHYLGPAGEALVVYSFLFRFFAGVIFAVIFWQRGFAVAVYTHAIYDIFVLVVFA
jgi:membrane protease YdiL (CAAX protease family)